MAFFSSALAFLVAIAPPVTATPENQPDNPSTIEAPPAGLAGLPNVEVTYYNVTGQKIRDIHRSLASAAPRGATEKDRLPATSGWSMAAGVKWTRTGDQCLITNVSLRFSGKATLPRLVVQPKTDAPVLAAWHDYVAKLEARQAAQLRFAYDRRDSVERAIREAGCDRWQAAADKALASLKEQQLLAFQDEVMDRPKLEEPKDKKIRKPSEEEVDRL